MKISFQNSQSNELLGSNSQKFYICTLELKINNEEICVEDTGSNKKEAKKKAIKKMVCKLIENGMILFGQKKKENPLNLGFPNKTKNNLKKEMGIKKLKKKSEKIISNMQININTNDFKGACTALCNLCDIKAIQWQEVNKKIF